MNDKVLALDAGTLYTPREKLNSARIIVDGKSIAEAGFSQRIAIPQGAHRIDASQWIVTPNFIDPHIHGAGGLDVMAGTWETLNKVGQTVARHGTTLFLPTTVSAPSETLTATIEKLGESLKRDFDGARPAGIHLEGPFINSSRRGTHQPSNIVPPDQELLYKWIRAANGAIRLITLAPEIDGNPMIAAVAGNYGIHVAMGHSNASFEEASTAARRGVCYAVHTFNAMREFTHREPGIIGTILSDDRIVAEIIADGIHVHPSVVRFFARAKKASGIVLATDATSATGMPDGSYVLGTETMTVTGGVCRDAEGRLAGSTLTQDVALKNFIDWTDFSIEEALRALTENPARALGLHGKGTIEAGADADLTIMDSNFRVMKTIVAGKLVFER
jgi:N-acetylglucosamine-6-phosphate deacetylase